MARILVVDDDQGIRSYLRRKLADAGHEVSEAENGLAAARIMRDDRFTLVITDIIMPEKEGIETIMEFRKKYPEIKIIAMSGKGNFLKMAQHLGADATLAKPFDFDDVLRAVASLV